MQLLEKCSNCLYYKALDGNSGECRKFTPVLLQSGESRWPGVKATDGCGQWSSLEIVERKAKLKEFEIREWVEQNKKTVAGLFPGSIEKARKDTAHLLVARIHRAFPKLPRQLTTYDVSIMRAILVADGLMEKQGKHFFSVDGTKAKSKPEKEAKAKPEKKKAAASGEFTIEMLLDYLRSQGGRAMEEDVYAHFGIPIDRPDKRTHVISEAMNQGLIDYLDDDTDEIVLVEPDPSEEF